MSTSSGGKGEGGNVYGTLVVMLSGLVPNPDRDPDPT
jgi:hypothetical protein